MNPQLLQRAIDKLAPHTDPDLQRLRVSILDVLDGADPRKALGLNTGIPGPSPLRRQRKADRNELIRELAERFYDGPLTARAKALGADLDRYLTTGWSLDRRRGQPYPPSPRRSLMFRICMADPDRPPPIGVSRLYEIVCVRLGNEPV